MNLYSFLLQRNNSLSEQLLESEKHCTTLKQTFNDTVSGLEQEKQVLSESVDNGRKDAEQNKAQCKTLKRQIDQLTNDLEYQQSYVEKQDEQARNEIEQLKHQLDQVREVKRHFI